MQSQSQPEFQGKSLPMVAATMPAPNPTPQIVQYLRSLCGLPNEQIERNLLMGECFEIKGDGRDIDTKLLEQVLNENDFYEKASQKALKSEVMQFLKDVVERWSREIATTEMKINEKEIEEYIAKLLPFGSYVLDLQSNSSDIDLICVCPNFISREYHFFKVLAERLESEDRVHNLTVRTSAKVPIITFQYKEIDIDISFCQLSKETVPRDIEKVISSELIASISDEQSKISLLGRKNNLMIVELTGRQKENFKETLRVVKVWAKNRGISSNGMGYLGGISWAILVAKVCQIFPYHKPAKLFVQFFKVYSLWNWRSMPVRLLAETTPTVNTRQSIMCVVTPGSGYNSTERVNSITFKVIAEEIMRATSILSMRNDYSDACRKLDFFSTFPLFIEIDICATELDLTFRDFQGMVESKVLKLLQMILKSYKKEIEDGSFKLSPNPKICKKNHPLYAQCLTLFIGLQLGEDVSVNLLRPVREWANMIDSARKTKNFNVHIFQVTPAQLNDIQTAQPKKKKEQKIDPRLLMKKKKTSD